ncbi:MAG: hypothetical protein ACOH13_09855 [Flavobacteriales bacterium]
MTLVIAMTLWTTIGYEQLDREDKRFMILAWPSLAFLIIFLGQKVLFEMNQISIDAERVEIRNFITRRVKEINKKDLKGFKDKFSNGYTLLLINQSDKVVAKLNDYYYKDFIAIRENLRLTYLGKVPTFWDRILKVEVSEDKE